jgi:2-oxoglutarate ferredoxin oxidoreductase subunit alpha
VVVLTDFFLNNRVENVPPLRASDTQKADWNIYPEQAVKGNYVRYRVTESGISPRAIPGMEGYHFSATGLEHTEEGIPNYSPENHMMLTEKRHRKIYGALADLPEPVEFSEQAHLDVGVIAWGSTFGSALEAVNRAVQTGLRVGALKITSLFPFHADMIRVFMDRCEEILIPELNFEGQLANLIGHLHRKDVIRLNRTTGIPFPVSAIVERLEDILGEKRG